MHDPQKAIEEADIVYADSWMSYHVPPSEKKKRIKILQPFQVNKELMRYAKSNVIFMHCLPAKRGEEVTKGVIDGKHSVVFDQAENRLHTEKAILLKLIENEHA
jgi:ornithine carbamoyltransferase